MRTQRKIQNAASLLPNRVKFLIFCEAAGCQEEGMACYSLEGQLAGNFCRLHRTELGYCLGCANEITAAEKEKYEHYCEACGNVPF